MIFQANSSCFLGKHLKRNLMETKLDIFAVGPKQGTARLAMGQPCTLSSSS